MNTLPNHYAQLLGLKAPWQVTDVDLSMEDMQVEIRVGIGPGQACRCPKCGDTAPIHDHREERRWRHLDTMQFTTVIVAKVPRTNCSACGVLTCDIPWAEPHGRFTLMFEAFAIEVLQAASSIERARGLLRLSWNSVQRLMNRAVERGLERRSTEQIRNVGLDEKSFGRGQDYITLLTDIDGSRILEVAVGRDEASADRVLAAIPGDQRRQVAAVAIDMTQSYENSVQKNLPNAEIVHDRFHISKHLNESVDKVRRQEHKKLKKSDDKTLTGTKQLWLYNPENISDEQWEQLQSLRELELKTGRAWAIREYFRWFWEYRYAGHAKRFFAIWYRWASRCRLEPVVKVARMLKRRLSNILTWFRHRISNGMAEGFNSRIQSIKAAARGFTNFWNYRTRILFFCGRLDLMPDSTHRH